MHIDWRVLCRKLFLVLLREQEKNKWIGLHNDNNNDEGYRIIRVGGTIPYNNITRV